MTTTNNHESLIEKVGGIEKARGIVGGAPDSYYCTGISDYTDGYDDDEKCPDCVGIQDLRTAIAQYELLGNSEDVTDMVTDIRNHISPNTKVIDHG